MNFYALISKIGSESLLSLYPVFVKNIGLSIDIQLWTRLIIYFAISLILCNISFISKYLFNQQGLFLGITNLIHIYVSYKGFQLLESGIAYTLFYTYPILIILYVGKKIHWSIFLALFGTFLLSYEQLKDNQTKKIEDNEYENKNVIKENFPYEGFVMIILAAITEAMIYFQVRNIPTKNNWNHLFIAYFIGTVIISLYLVYTKYLNPKKEDNKEKEVKENFESKKEYNKVLIALVINGIIGAFGYFLRFFAATRLEPSLYAFLSYIGIFMSFIYGVIFNKEKFTIVKLIGSLLIFISYYYMKKSI
jgi:drug/metabolite transporter (DMT)-like permease